MSLEERYLRHVLFSRPPFHLIFVTFFSFSLQIHICAAFVKRKHCVGHFVADVVGLWLSALVIHPSASKLRKVASKSLQLSCRARIIFYEQLEPLSHNCDFAFGFVFVHVWFRTVHHLK